MGERFESEESPPDDSQETASELVAQGIRVESAREQEAKERGAESFDTRKFGELAENAKSLAGKQHHWGAEPDSPMQAVYRNIRYVGDRMPLSDKRLEGIMEDLH